MGDAPGPLGVAGRGQGPGLEHHAAAAGDFDNDGYEDLAISSEETSGQSFGSQSGEVHVLYGSASGLTARDELWYQGRNGLADTPEEGDSFGYSMATGDLNGDGFDDLVIGASRQTERRSGAGAFHVLWGGDSGLTADGIMWTQDSEGIPSRTGEFESFAAVLTTGDFDNDGYDDVVAATTRERFGNVRSGAVTVIPGASSGLDAHRSTQWHLDKPGVVGAAVGGETFGRSMATGDFDNDGVDDLAVGMPSRDQAGIDNIGAVLMLLGRQDLGLGTAGDKFFHPNQAGIQGTVNDRMHFGWSLTVGEFNSQPGADLAIGAPFEDLGNLQEVGATHILPGSPSGLTATGDRVIHQNSPGVKGAAEELDQAGLTLGQPHHAAN